MSSDRCGACPCPAEGDCLGLTTHPQFCGWAASGEPAKVATVVNRSALGSDPPPVSAPPARRRTAADVRAELVKTNAFYCRSCPTACAKATCLCGMGQDEWQNAPLTWCVACLTARAT